MRRRLRHRQPHQVRRRVVIRLRQRDRDDRFAVRNRFEQLVHGPVLHRSSVGHDARLRNHVFNHDQVLDLAHLVDVVAHGARLRIEHLRRVEAVVAGDQRVGFDRSCIRSHLREKIRGDRAAKPQKILRTRRRQLAQRRHRLARRAALAVLCGEELRELRHAMRAVAPVRMHRRVVEEDPVAPGPELLSDDELLVRAPVRIVHAGRAVIAAVP